MQEEVHVRNTNDHQVLSYPFSLMLLPCISPSTLEMMIQKERTGEGSLFFPLSVLPYSSVNQKQRVLVEYSIPRKERKTIEFMFCRVSKVLVRNKSMGMYELQNTNCGTGYSVSELDAPIFAFQQELQNIKGNGKH